MDGIFNRYTIYYDESNNCLKFKFKNVDGDLNVDCTEDFVLAGVVFEGTESSVDIDSIFSKLQLQKSVIDLIRLDMIHEIAERSDQSNNATYRLRVSQPGLRYAQADRIRLNL